MTKLKKKDNEKLAKALRENLKKRKVQANKQKEQKEIISKGSVNKDG
ncbi:MAG: hypothetical protein P8K09_06990 [Hyphomicrobiales bacterium]|jgi:hypothetical protein|nr:hypothetical protein [Hyphomicrobiales bacterium]|tara:strand:- start:101 stop:241 length:141 start_codon:yes stop_codon:yes gene_type:complete